MTHGTVAAWLQCRLGFLNLVTESWYYFDTWFIYLTMLQAIASSPVVQSLLIFN
ncbi:hypothetical protein [Nostoc sp. FACHB-145]|uniref:hypothetical protein n=1 Tax=Nostoc sp. FACHB-145 TaxID=2692836 RepID=UPI0016848377|nr:hypothetical protein [Nostoc sp. FACHB-145]MBD2471415.1 hypothetical protein [Nostoc sp. FACHB-145]